MRSPLEKTKRNELEKAIEKAREIAEVAATEELQRLAVADKAAADYLSEEQRIQRNRLRAHARQLGDSRQPNGIQGTTLLVVEIAYQHWHRMLFSRFLAENNLLMYEDGSTPLSIGDCFELAEEETGDSSNGWRFAANYAATMLPQIFRNHSPVFEIELAPNHQKALEQLLEGIDQDTFQAQDSLGWCYQFWQSKRKDEVNASGVKIGAREISPVTQLFTEPYMVSFLLDNALGAWWANRQLTDDDLAQANSENDLRQLAAIDGIPLEYLRFIKTQQNDGGFAWSSATGAFEQWPNDLSNFKMLDPCCGSGHFLVATFLMLVPMRMRLEDLSAAEAVEGVLQQNIHGLELDQRCVELAAFALAFEAWRFPDAGGYRMLPELNLACSGLPLTSKKTEWLELAGSDEDLAFSLESLYSQFKDAPILGSLINPKESLNAKSLLEIDWVKVEPLVSEILQSEEHARQVEMGVTARGIAKAAHLLSDQYCAIFTNPPYLVKGKQSKKLQEFSSHYYAFGDADLATVFLKRFDEFLVSGGIHCSVTPLNWFFLKSYEQLRNHLLDESKILNLTKIGSGATAKASWDVLRGLAIIRKGSPEIDYVISGVEATTPSEESRALEIKQSDVKIVTTKNLRKQPNTKFVFDLDPDKKLLEELLWSYQGPSTGDYPSYGRKYWEVPENGRDWVFQQISIAKSEQYFGLENILLWEDGAGRLAENPKAAIRGAKAHGTEGIAVTQTRKLPVSLYAGGFFDNNVAVLSLDSSDNLAALWCYCSSDQYYIDVRRLDEKLGVTNATLAKVPFDLDQWQRIGKMRYPHGLPAPHTDRPTQWIYHGHPCGSVIWDKAKKKVLHGHLRTDDSVLQTAVARLLGYRWPAEVDSRIKLAKQMREWVSKCSELHEFAADDGIVCLSAIRGERTAHDRLLNLLQASYGDQWSTEVFRALLESVGASDLDKWLRDKFFEQHCMLFQNRPFIWHIWDGLKDGFHVFVNYHQLDYRKLERLIYSYLDDWIRTQSHQESENVDGAKARLIAAQNLKVQLENILKGEVPYDIFVRWKSLEEQVIGWNPDLNDGVRLNIRPFIMADEVGKKGAGILRAKPNIRWNKDRGKDVESSPWYRLGSQYDGKEGDRINEHHLTLEEKARRTHKG